MIRKSILALVLLTSIGFAQTYKQTYQYEIALPAGWTQISGETVGFLIQELHHPAMPPTNPKFDFLYERISNDPLFTRPYILVQINSASRLTSRELKAFGEKNFKYDETTHYLWGYRDSTIEVIIPTNEGTINVFCYSSKADFPANKTQFEQIIRSIQVNKSLAYQESFLRDVPLVGLIFHDYKINGILIALLITALIIAKFQGRKKSVPVS